MTDSGVTITREAVQDALSRRELKNRDKLAIEREIEELDRRLDAMRVLAPNLFPSKADDDLVLFNTREVVRNVVQNVTLVPLLGEIAREEARPLLPKDFRAKLIEQGRGDVLKNENYLYTAIKRAIARGLLVKQGEAYAAP